MDAECEKLCNAINKLDGITTVESCCGHHTEKYTVWFTIKNLENLPPLLYFLMPCHCGFCGWHVIAKTDCGMSPVVFLIEGNIGAFDEANKIAELIEEYVEKGKDEQEYDDEDESD